MTDLFHELRRDPLGILGGAALLLAAWATLAVLLTMIGGV